MKLLKHFLFICLLWLNTSTIFAQTNAKVIRVVDGDTYQLQSDNKVFTVRLANVDAPESKQQFGSEATKNVSALILHQNVLVTEMGKDRYNRTIGSISINGMALDSVLICNGWAWHYAAYNDSKELAALQELAIKKHLGLWKQGVKNVCLPSVFRKLSAAEKKKFSA